MNELHWHAQRPTPCQCLTLLRLSLQPLQHLLLRGQRLLQELHVELVLLLHLLLLPQPHLVADVALEAEAQRHHWVADAGVGGRTHRMFMATFAVGVGAPPTPTITAPPAEAVSIVTSEQRKVDTGPHESSSDL